MSKLYIGIVILIISASSTKVSFISVLDLLNGAQFLNTTFVSLSPPVTVIIPVTKIYASEYNHKDLIPMNLLKILSDFGVNSYL